MISKTTPKRAFTSPIRFFGSDQIEGMQKAVDIVAERAAKVAAKYVTVTLLIDSIMITDDGKHLDVDYNEETERWEYQGIFNHPIDISDENSFGLKNDEMLTLVQLSSDYMNVNTYNGETEYSLHFENGITGNKEPIAYELSKKRIGTSINWRFDSSLFLNLTMDIPITYYKDKLQELVKQYPEKIFTLCIQPDECFLERFEYSCSENGDIKEKHSKIRGII